MAYLEEAERSYLVSWVPPTSIAVVTEALTQPTGSIAWLEESGVGLAGRFLVG